METSKSITFAEYFNHESGSTVYRFGDCVLLGGWRGDNGCSLFLSISWRACLWKRSNLPDGAVVACRRGVVAVAWKSGLE